MENFQVKLLNNLIYQITKVRKENKNDKRDNLIEMSSYNENKYFYFEIYLIEMLPKSNKSFIYINKLFPNLSPQEIFIKYLKGNNIMTNYRDLIYFETGNIDLFNMVTPNLTKNIWYLEKDLIPNRLVKVYCIMNLIDMNNMLKNCPITNICLSPSLFKLNNPQEFVETINKLNNAEKKCLNFIPYLRDYSRYNTIKNNAIYYLHIMLSR